jgi:hypothetical protein
MAGQEIRLISIPADRGKGFGAFDNGGRLERQLGTKEAAKALAGDFAVAWSEQYGTAGPAFLASIFEIGTAKVQETLSTYIANWDPSRGIARAGACVPASTG